jgi:glycosyltransferase involved in cell wall biosynthesis
MRVLLTTESDVRGGAERMLITLALALRDRGHDVCFAGRERTPSFLCAELKRVGFAVHALELMPGRPLAACRSLARIVHIVRPDVIHAHMIALSVYATAVGMITARPVVVTLHGTGHETATFSRRAALRFAIRFSSASIAVAHGLKDELTAALGPVAKWLSVIPNGAPRGQGNRTAFRSQQGIDEDELLLVLVGNLLPVKGHRVFVEAFARMRHTAPHRALILGRDDGTGQEIRDLLDALNLSDRVLLLGERTDVQDALAAADIFVHPSFNEAMPMAIVEAMHHGAAIVASNVGGIPELITDGKTGRLVPPGDADALAAILDDLAADRSARRRLGAAAELRAQTHHSPEAMAIAYEEAYMRSMSARRRQAAA